MNRIEVIHKKILQKKRLFEKVRDKDHDPTDNDCMCFGCMKVLDRMVKEMQKSKLKIN